MESRRTLSREPLLTNGHIDTRDTKGTEDNHFEDTPAYVALRDVLETRYVPSSLQV